MVQHYFGAGELRVRVWEWDMTWEKGSGDLLGYQISNFSPTQEIMFDLTTMLDNINLTKLDPAVCGRKLASNGPHSAFS